jgi:hypothetical protein
MHSSEVALGYFPWLLRNTLLELGNTVYPMYVTHSWNEPNGHLLHDQGPHQGAQPYRWRLYLTHDA